MVQWAPSSTLILQAVNEWEINVLMCVCASLACVSQINNDKSKLTRLLGQRVIVPRHGYEHARLFLWGIHFLFV